MAGQSTQHDKCPNSPSGEHIYQVDKDDKQFKVCQWCDTSKYRTDEELVEGKV